MKATSIVVIAALIIGNASAGPVLGADAEYALMGTFQVVLPPTGEWWNADSRQPSVVLTDGVYRMWFMGNSTSDLERAQIGYATSGDGIHWSSPQLVLDRPGNNYSTYAPSALMDGPQFVMYLSQYWIWRAGEWANYIDRAASADGVNWVDEQTVLTGTDILYDWQGRDVYDAHVFAENGGYVMYYLASEHHDSPLGDVQSVGRATSLDGVTWTNRTQLMSSPPNTNLGKPHVVKQPDGSYVMYRNNAPPWPEYTVIERATSLDGFTWSAFETLVSLPGHYLGSPWHLQDADGKRYLYFTSDSGIARIELVAGVVPVTLSDLTAQREAESILLTWHVDNQDVSCTVQRAKVSAGPFVDLGFGVNERHGRVSFRDDTVADGSSAYYRIAFMDEVGTRKFSSTVEARGTPSTLDVWVAQSNPVRGATVRFAFVLPLHTALARMSVYDIFGRRVKTLRPSANSVLWDGCDERGSAVASGVYFVCLEAGGSVRTKRFAFMK